MAPPRPDITFPASNLNSRVKRLFSTPSDQPTETPTFPTVQLFPRSHGTVCLKENSPCFRGEMSLFFGFQDHSPKNGQQKVIICGLLGYNRDRFMGITIGTQPGSHQITAPLGKAGMGSDSLINICTARKGKSESLRS